MTHTERNWFRAALLMLGSIGFFAAIRAVELDLGRWNPDIRFVRDPAGAAMVFLGISHFVVALVFTATSRSMRSMRAWIHFAGMLALGVVLCAVYVRVLSASAPLAAALFLIYFLVHDFRDQVFFYFTNRDASSSSDPAALGQLLRWTPLLIVGLVALALLAPVAFGGPNTRDASELLNGLSPRQRWISVALPFLLAILASLRIRDAWGRAGSASWWRHVLAHRPIHVVFAGTLVVLLAGLAVGWRTHTVVILHVTTWYVFSVAQLKNRRAGAPASIGAWLRGTPAGFRTLHVGLALGAMLAGLVWAYGFDNASAARPLWALFDADNFPLWTILHVTVSFRPR